MEDFGTAARARVLAAYQRQIEAEALIGAFVAQRTARLIREARGGSVMRRRFLDETLATVSPIALTAGRAAR